MRNSYSGKDDQDFLAMCLLMYATDHVTEPNKMNPVQLSMVDSMIADIEKVMDWYINYYLVAL